MQKAIPDQMNRLIRLDKFPERIISLVPSQTELLYDLGLYERLVGITKFCIHPGSVYKTIPRIGGTKKIDPEKIRQLQPDLIIGNKEENEKDQIESLEKEFTVWMSDIQTLDDAFDMIKKIGILTGTESKATEIIEEIKVEFASLPVIKKRPDVLYLIWKDPWMAAGSNTFIDDLLTRAGFSNVLRQKRFPVLNPEEIKTLDPDFIFLSSEPFPFTRDHAKSLDSISSKSKAVLVDGELFSWYGSRLKKSAAYFKQLRKDLSL